MDEREMLDRTGYDKLWERACELEDEFLDIQQKLSEQEERLKVYGGNENGR